MSNCPALIKIGTATAIVAALGMGFILDRGATWRLRTPAYQALASLRSSLAERPRCHEDRPSPHSSICQWRGEASGTDFIIFGDSHAEAIAPELAMLLSDGGKRTGISLIARGCGVVAGIRPVRRKKEGDRCHRFVSAALEIIARERPRVVVYTGRWATLASAVPAPFDHSPSATALSDLENDEAPIELSEALKRTVELIRASGARVFLVGPVPEMDFHGPQALVRSLHRGGPTPQAPRVDFDVRQARVMEALAKVATMESVTVVYPHAVLCDEATCAVAEGLQSLYLDDDHLSPLGSLRVSTHIMAAVEGLGGALTRVEIASEPAGSE